MQRADPVVPPVAPSRLRSQVRRKDTLAGWGFIAPFLVVYLVFLLWPVLQAVYMSGFSWDLLTLDRESVGIDNFRRMLGGTEMGWSATHLLGWRLALLGLVGLAWAGVRRGTVERSLAWATTVGLGLVIGVGLLGVRPDPINGRWYDATFWTSFGNTVRFVVLSTPLTVGLGLGLALLLSGDTRLVRVFRAVFFCSYVLPVSVVTLIWGFLLDPQQGLVGATLDTIGFDPIAFLTSPTLAMPAIVVATMWWTVGFNMVLFVAGMQDIEPALYEAADLDGASWFGRLRYITLPGLRRTFLLVTVLQVIASFQIFGQVYIMTRGGPGGSTRVLIQHIYETGFRDHDLGYASALSVVLFAVMLVVSVVQFRLLGEEDDA